MEDNAALLKAASDQVAEVIHSYLSRMFPCSGTHLRYEDAVSVVQKIKKETLREQMLYLLRKVSDAATWDSAVRKLKEHYKDVPDKRIKKIYSKFDALDIISLASCGGNNTVAMAKESKIAQDNSLITGEDEITTQNDVSKDEFERQGIIEQVKQELFAMFPMSDAQAEQANENTVVVNEYIQKNLYSMDGIENKTDEIIDRIYEDIMNVSNAANVFPYADKYGTVINSMDDVVANYAHNIVYEDSLGTSLRDAIRISVEDDLLNDAHGYEYVTYDSLLSNAIVTIEFMVLDNQELHDALNERNIETIDSRYDFFSIAREYEDITY